MSQSIVAGSNTQFEILVFLEGYFLSRTLRKVTISDVIDIA